MVRMMLQGEKKKWNGSYDVIRWEKERNTIVLNDVIRGKRNRMFHLMLQDEKKKWNGSYDVIRWGKKEI